MKLPLLVLATLLVASVGFIQQHGCYAGFGLWIFMIPGFITLQLITFRLLSERRRKG